MSIKDGFDEFVDENLRDSILEIKSIVLEGEEVNYTAFCGKVSGTNAHGQHDESHGPSSAAMDPESLVIEENKPKAVSQAIEVRANGGEAPESRRGSVFELMRDQRKDVYRLDEVLSAISHPESTDTSKRGVDNHYDPILPKRYIQYRLKPALEEYKARIPHCSKIRTISQVLLILGGICLAGLSYFNVNSWAPAVAIITMSITAFLEFHGTNNKISRYSFAVHTLQQLISWWQTLPESERLDTGNIDRLVVRGEDLFQREQNAWKVSSHAVKMLQVRRRIDSDTE